MRPEHLPDYDSPPLDEVVLGVQFVPPKGYSSVYTKDVWEEFKQLGFPTVQEQPALDPSFEMFGGGIPQSGAQLRFGPAPVRGRLWFISEDQNHLVQFQEDRLLLNWRKHPNGQDYPRFEGIAESFEEAMHTLQKFFKSSLGMDLDINQAEVSYINVVPVSDYAEASKWFRFWSIENDELESLSLVSKYVVNDSSGKPHARLTSELQSVVIKKGNTKAFRLSFDFRGKPPGSSIEHAMSFIQAGREEIVKRFSELTTQDAHVIWEKRK